MALILLASTNAFGHTNGLSVGFNFGADEPNGQGLGSLQPSAIAGAVPQANWNNLNEAGGSAAALIANDAGSPVVTTISVTWSSPNTWSTTGRGEENNGFPPGPDRSLMTGVLDTDNGANVATVTVTGIPANFTTLGYDVLVYCLGVNGGSLGVAYSGAYTIGGTTKFGTSPTNPIVHIEDLGVDRSDTGTYVRFTDLRSPLGDSPSSFTLVASADAASYPGKVNFRAPVNGIQIVARNQLTISVNGLGAIAKTPDQTGYSPGSTVSLTATPSPGWVFSSWSGNASGTANPLSVTMTTNKSITANFTNPSGCVLPSGLVSWWPGAGDANDLIGNNNGTLQNGATNAAGKVGQGFVFSGGSGYVVAPNSASLNFGTSDSFTIETWVRIDALSGVGDDALVDKRAGASSPHTGYLMDLVGPAASRHIEFFVGDGSSTRRVSTSPILDSNFHHVAAVVDRSGGGSLTIYLDGVAQPTASLVGLGSFANTTRLFIGHQTLDAVTGVQPFHGVIDELSFYNRALTAGEALSIYNAGSAGKCLTPLSVTSVSKSGNNLNISWQAQLNVTYRVQYKTNLNAATPWTDDVSGDVTASGSTASKSVGVPANAPQRFYRVEMFR